MLMGKFSYTWQLMGASWEVLKRDPKLLIFPLLSGICCMIVMASFAMAAIVGGHLHLPQTPAEKVIHWAALFCFYFVNYFLITFFNAGIVACAVSRMAGGEPTIAGGFREALSRIHLIAAWALLSATVGVVLRIIGGNSGKFGRIVTAILGAGWSILTFLVVPVLVVENKGPVEAFKTSTQLLRKTWGERLIGNFSFGLVFFLLLIPGFVGVFTGMATLVHSATLGGLVLLFSFLYFIVLALIHSALVSIFQAAIYMYTQGVADQRTGFPVALLRDAMSAN
jgi:Family of unknown function (DUF6159)